MAYVSQDRKRALSVDIKAVLKKYGMKGSISVRNHSTLVVTLKSGKLDILGNWHDNVMATTNGRVNGFGAPITKPEYMDVNVYWIDEGYTGKVKDFLNELLLAMKGEDWFDKSDIQSDYFHTAWYNDIYCGRWDKPYTLEV